MIEVADASVSTRISDASNNDGGTNRGEEGADSGIGIGDAMKWNKRRKIIERRR